MKIAHIVHCSTAAKNHASAICIFSFVVLFVTLRSAVLKMMDSGFFDFDSALNMDSFSLSANLLDDYQVVPQQQQLQEKQLYVAHKSVPRFAAEEEELMMVSPGVDHTFLTPPFSKLSFSSSPIFIVKQEDASSMAIEPQSPLAIKMEEDVFQPLQSSVPAAGVSIGSEKPTKKRRPKKAVAKGSLFISVEKCKVANCPHIFENKLELYVHLKAFHPDLKTSKIIHSCSHPTCFYASNRASSLKRHMLSVHLNVHPYTCKGCGKQYKSSSGYRLHISKYHPEQLKQKNLK